MKYVYEKKYPNLGLGVLLDISVKMGENSVSLSSFKSSLKQYIYSNYYICIYLYINLTLYSNVYWLFPVYSFEL